MRMQCAHIEHDSGKPREHAAMTAAGRFEIPATRFGESQGPYLSARQVSDLLGITMSELAGLVGVARNTLAARKGARKVDAALSPVVRILAMAEEMAGSGQRA